jgi:hypothetical protein
MAIALECLVETLGAHGIEPRQVSIEYYPSAPNPEDQRFELLVVKCLCHASSLAGSTI